MLFKSPIDSSGTTNFQFPTGTVVASPCLDLVFNLLSCKSKQMRRTFALEPWSSCGYCGRIAQGDAQAFDTVAGP
jgi:hypothetical protein